MSLTLLVENNPKIESFYKLNLTTWVGLQTITKKSAELAIKLLDAGTTTVQLIIVRAKIEQEDSAAEIVKYLQGKKLSIPVIVIGPGKEVPGSFAHVPNSLELKILVKSCAQALGITAKDMSNKVVPNYFPVPIRYFREIKRPVCPVYAQDRGNPKKYFLQLEKLKDYDPSLIDQLVEEGVENLFINKMDRLDFVNNVTSELMARLKDEELSDDEQVSAGEKNLELLSQKLLTIGVSEETIALAKKNIESMRNSAKKHPNLSSLIERLLSNKAGFLYQHTQILTYVCLHIIGNIDWGTAEQEEKISFIALFHDIALETDEQAKIHSMPDLKKSSIPDDKKTLVEKHAQMAAEYVAKFPHAPMGADQIIRQHHGALNGVGFTDHYGANVSPMAIVFIVAEEFTRIIMSRESIILDRNQMLKELKEKFTHPKFKKILDIIQTITL